MHKSKLDFMQKIWLKLNVACRHSTQDNIRVVLIVSGDGYGLVDFYLRVPKLMKIYNRQGLD